MTWNEIAALFNVAVLIFWLGVITGRAGATRWDQAEREE